MFQKKTYSCVLLNKKVSDSSLEVQFDLINRKCFIYKLYSINDSQLWLKYKKHRAYKHECLLKLIFKNNNLRLI